MEGGPTKTILKASFFCYFFFCLFCIYYPLSIRLSMRDERISCHGVQTVASLFSRLAGKCLLDETEFIFSFSHRIEYLTYTFLCKAWREGVGPAPNLFTYLSIYLFLYLSTCFS